MNASSDAVAGYNAIPNPSQAIVQTSTALTEPENSHHVTLPSTHNFSKLSSLRIPDTSSHLRSTAQSPAFHYLNDIKRTV
jgi:hypothetical protein